MKSEFAKRGVENPIRDIIHDNVYVMEDNSGMPFLQDFYERHYHDSVSVDTAYTFGDIMLFRYKLKKDSL